MCWEAGNDQVMLRISRSLVERTLVGYLGHPLDKPLHFELGAGATARPAVLSGGLRHPISRPGAAQAGAVAGRATGRLDPADLAPAQLQRDARRRSSILPRHVRRAQDYLQAHAHEAAQRRSGAGGAQRAASQRFRLGASSTICATCAERPELLSGEAASVAAWRCAARNFQQRPRPATWRPARRCGGTDPRDSRRNRRRSWRLPQNGITSLASSWLPRAGCAPEVLLPLREQPAALAA